MKKNLNLIFVLMLFSILTSFTATSQNEADRNPLGYAVLKGDVATVQSLLKKGVDINKTHDKETPLVLSVKQQNSEIFHLLLSAKGIKIDAMSTYIWTGNGSKYTSTALISAVNEQKVDLVRALLEKGANADLFDKNTAQTGEITSTLTALMNAILLNNDKGVEMAKLIIEKSKNIDVKSPTDKEGITALIMAARFPRYNEMSKLMMKKGAKLELPNAMQPAYTAVGQAILGGNPDLVKYLLDNGAKIDNKTDKAYFHLAMALGVENLKTIEILLDYGIDPNTRLTATKYPVINHCVKCKDPKVLELMIARGADVNAKDGIGQSVLKYANGGKKVKKNIAILKKHGAVE
jgi:ankyrin repeat protein